MGKDLVDVTMKRATSDESWGFRLAGGKGTGQPLTVTPLSKDSLAAKVGLLADDFLVSVAGVDVADMTHDEVEKAIQAAGNKFQMVIERWTDSDRKISFERSAMTVSLKLGGGGGASVAKVDEAFISNVPVTEDTPSLLDNSVDFKKYESKPMDLSESKALKKVDMSKTYNRKDWNCPWVRKDGRGLKQAVRAVDELMYNPKTSHQHFYSEPRSIIGGNEPLLSPEELQEIIRAHGANSPTNEELAAEGNGEETKYLQDQMEAEMQEEKMMKEDREELVRREENIIQDEIATSNVEENMKEQQQEANHESEVDNNQDSTAPPDLEQIITQTQKMVGEQSLYEPSADELIEVLKNLENLAAANPDLYRSIVNQIKGSQQYVDQAYYEQQQQQQQQFEQQMYYEQQQQQQESEYYQSVEQEQVVMNGSVSQFEETSLQEAEEQRYEEVNSQEQEAYQQEQRVQQEQQEVSYQNHQSSTQEVVSEAKGETEEERKQRSKMERLEREANEQVREALAKQREIKLAQANNREPAKPKEITVVAGDGKKVTITLGAEKNEDADSRKQVAEAAGLKHVPLPDFDDAGSAWAGSLKRTERSRLVQSRQEMTDGGSPWAGSLRHVPENNRRKPARKDDDDTYGTAPWMGTLRHVVHDNKVTPNFGVNQFQSKRYPDEDAVNPFEGQGGIYARPAFPLTPAAVINGCALSREEMSRRQDEDEVSRIRGNIKASETLSSALMKALMPKLLKMHESKYPAMDRDEASKIMEEILAMQNGLNMDQQADANEEAEMMIKAIMQDEIGHHVYSKMADDLEAAAQMRKKSGAAAKKKKVKSSKKAAASTVQSAA